MKAKILITLLAVAAIAGCTIPGISGITPGTTAIGGGQGLEITSFTAEPNTVFSGSTVRLIIEVQNKGGTNVQTSDALLWLTGSNFQAWGNTNAQVYEHFDREMKAEDVVRGIPADTKRFALSLTAPSLTPGQTRADTFIGRVYHEYETSANGNVWVYTDTEADAARTAGRSLYTSSFTYTKGPVGLQVSVSPDPIILYGAETNFTLYIKISNLATGTIYYPQSVTYTTGSENITLASYQLNNVTVNATGTYLNIGNDCKGSQELVAGKETTLVCDVQVDPKPSTFGSYALSVTVNYGYYTEKTASVTIQGK